MARKKKNNNDEQVNEIVNEYEVLQDGFRMYMQNTVNDDDLYEDSGDKVLIPTGIDLVDTYLGGGITVGFTQCIGQTGSGKSTFASKFLANATKMYKNKFIGIYVDRESSMTKERLRYLGVQNPSIYTDLTVETLFKLIENIIAFKVKADIVNIPSVIIWDSIANTPTDAEADLGSDDNSISQQARVLSKEFKRYANRLKKYRIALFAVNQLRNNIKMDKYTIDYSNLKYLGKTNKIPGGESAMFNSQQILLFRSGTDISEYGYSGNRVRCKTIKNKYFIPNVEFEVCMSFMHGFSNFWTNYELLKSYNLIQSGAWCRLNGYEGKGNSFRQENALDKYIEDEQFRNIFNDHVITALDSINSTYNQEKNVEYEADEKVKELIEIDSSVNNKNTEDTNKSVESNTGESNE